MLLVPPAFALDGGLAPFPCAHPYDSYSQPGMAATAAGAMDEALAERVNSIWPAFGRVRGRTCCLLPGQVLCIPPYWSSHVETLPPPASASASASSSASAAASTPASASAVRTMEGGGAKTEATAPGCHNPGCCISLVVQLHQYPAGGQPADPQQEPSPGALTLQASRLIEHWVDAEVGLLRTRDVLLCMAGLLQRQGASMQLAVEAALRKARGGGGHGRQGSGLPMSGCGEARIGIGASGGSSSEQEEQQQREEEGQQQQQRDVSLLLASLKQHWLPLLVQQVQRDGGLSATGGGSSSGEGDSRGGSPEVRGMRLAASAQAVFDACAACCLDAVAPRVGGEGCSPGAAARGAPAGGSGAPPVPPTPEGCGAPPRQPEDVLLSLCDGRLLPTSWLDEYGERETGVPARLTYSYAAPQLTLEEARFPELFRASIQVRRPCSCFCRLKGRNRGEMKQEEAVCLCSHKQEKEGEAAREARRLQESRRLEHQDVTGTEKLKLET